ncbi:MAG: cyclopropane-fatty-acyl-phospholipid synthase family protein [Desulfobulbaceae bacterium]|nr:cyclopropane-fatty-acyl-phospholipid synthase family protein [Desulfobulbaceae bacterium]
MSKHISAIKEKKVKLCPGPMQIWCKKVLFELFKDLQFGTLSINNCGKLYEFGTSQGRSGISASVSIHDPKFYPDVLFKGSIGAAESYMKGYWTTENLTDVVRLFVINTDLLNRKMDAGWSKVTAPFMLLYHRLRKNTRSGSKKNIVAHYDLSNDFFSLFLDKTMGYSCGIFEHENSSLHEAQVAKFDRICKKLDLNPSDHLVEIGGGWGGFALHAVQNYGCRVTTTTISDNQYRYMQRLFSESGMADRIKVMKQDYRELTGKYDKLVSIEMIEAVGHHFLDTFFERCCRLLKPDGMMALQTITIPDHEFNRHKHSVDFIKRYIFPGSCILSVGAITKSFTQKTDFQLIHYEDITPHYAITLRIWRQRFFANLEKVKAMGFSQSFIRMWEFYLASCEGSFQEHYNGNVQMIFARPQSSHKQMLPSLDS